jgi:hypothetical protein
MQVVSSGSDCDMYFAGAQFECNLGHFTVPDEVSCAFPWSLQGSAILIPQITSELFPCPSYLIIDYLFCHFVQNLLGYEQC